VPESGGAADEESVLHPVGSSRTSLGDRAFRPDVEGLRALAVSAVVLYHFQVPGFSGGFIGVDVFFVISGYVICGVLLRERFRTDATSMVGFYGRRARRILPAATVVIIATVAATFLFDSTDGGRSTAIDGRWVAVFLSNFRFDSPSSNPLSPLRNFWSLAVEEQFYLVFPALFAGIVSVRRGPTLRIRLLIALGTISLASFTLSVVQTGRNPLWAYLSPFTRAWELAFGALIAVGAIWLKDIPEVAARVLTWVGIGLIVFASVTFSESGNYPGWKVAVPVIGTALVIGGGVTVPRFGAESILGLAPFGWLGKRSYSVYLWHWPVLIVVAAAGYAVSSWPIKVTCLVGVMGISMLTFRVVENPVRHLALPPGRSVQLGLVLVGVTVALLTVAIQLS